MTTYYVGIGGNDANAGTSWALRKLTLNGAEDIPVAAGDEVVVGPGTYRELLTVDVSGTAGNLITYTADYTGARTSGVKGIVRVTGSNDDITVTRASCITATSKDYRKFVGFLFDLVVTGYKVSATTATGWEITNCAFDGPGTGGSSGVFFSGTGTANIVEGCYFNNGAGNTGIYFYHTALVDNTGHIVRNCIFNGSLNRGIQITKIGGVTIQNCYIRRALTGIDVELALTAGQTTTVNNCIIVECGTGLLSAGTAYMTENYNTVYGCTTARTNVTAGANSVARPPLNDMRWFFEALNGGRFITPFDLSSYSTLVEYNSGTGAPSTDLRGASTVGTYREWGALEYNANYRTQGPVSIAPIGGIG